MAIKQYHKLSLSLIVCLFTFQVSALTDTAEVPADAVASNGKLRVEWQDPDSYRDVRAANGPDKPYRDNVFFQIEKHLTKITKKLPEGQTLTLTFTDVDLAGQVWPAQFQGMPGTGDVRIVRGINYPRFDFNYSLINTAGNVLKQGEESLKDMSFQQRVNRIFRNDPLRYEKALLERWLSRHIFQPVDSE